MIGGDQVQAHAARFQVDQEERERGRILEQIDLRLAIFGLPIQVGMRQIALRHLDFENGQSLDELRKDQGFVPFAFQGFERFE